MPEKTSSWRWRMMALACLACAVLFLVYSRFFSTTDREVKAVPQQAEPAAISVVSPAAKEEARLKEVQAAIAETMAKLRDQNMRSMPDSDSPLYREFEAAGKIVADALESHPVIIARKKEIERLGVERDAVVKKLADACDERWAARKENKKDNDKDKELAKVMAAYGAQEKELLGKKAELEAGIEPAKLSLRMEDPEIARLEQVVAEKHARMRTVFLARPEVQALTAKLNALQKESAAILRSLPVLRAQTNSSMQKNAVAEGSAGRNG